MMAAALIPLIFLLALFVLLVFGAWPMGLLTGFVLIGLLIGIAVGLLKTTRMVEST